MTTVDFIMVIETVLSMLTYICHFKHMAHKVWSYFETHVGFTLALFNILVQWHGFQPDDHGFNPKVVLSQPSIQQAQLHGSKGHSSTHILHQVVAYCAAGMHEHKY